VELFLDAHARPPKRIILDLVPPMTLSTATRRAASSMATTTAIVTCRSTSPADGICWPLSYAAPTSMQRPARSRKWHGLSRRSAGAGRR
jgi:hypothetical protein